MATRTPSSPPASSSPAPLAVAAQHRLLLAIALLVFLVIGAVVAIATGEWWTVAVAAGLHALGTGIVYAVVFRMLAAKEHPGNTRVEELEARGARDADVEATRRAQGGDPRPNLSLLLAASAALGIVVAAATLILFGVVDPAVR